MSHSTDGDRIDLGDGIYGRVLERIRLNRRPTAVVEIREIGDRADIFRGRVHVRAADSTRITAGMVDAEYWPAA